MLNSVRGRVANLLMRAPISVVEGRSARRNFRCQQRREPAPTSSPRCSRGGRRRQVGTGPPRCCARPGTARWSVIRPRPGRAGQPRPAHPAAPGPPADLEPRSVRYRSFAPTCGVSGPGCGRRPPGRLHRLAQPGRGLSLAFTSGIAELLPVGRLGVIDPHRFAMHQTAGLIEALPERQCAIWILRAR